MHTPTRFAFAALLAGGVLLPLSAHAQIIEVALFRSQFYTQQPATTITQTGADFDARLFTQHSGDVGVNQVTPGSVTLTYPNGSSGTKTGALDNTNTDGNDLMTTPPSGTISEYNSFTDHDGTPGHPLLLTAADVDTAYPKGDYTVNYSGGSLPAGSVTVNYAGPPDPYSNVPQFTTPTYNALQGLNATQSHTLNFNTDVFSTNPAVNEHLLFFTVFDAVSGAVVYGSNQNQDMTTNPITSVLLPGGVLMPGTQYAAELDFSERIAAFSPSTSDPNGTFTEQGFDQRTDVFFTTAPPVVPEASTTVSFGLLIVLGLGGVAIAAKRKKTA